MKTIPTPKAILITFRTSPASATWRGRSCIGKYRGQIDEQFAFLAFRTAPLVAASTMDAKIATADMASHMMVWAEIGRPNQREWTPQKWDRYAKDDGLYPSGYNLFEAEPSASLQAAIQENEKTRLMAANHPADPPDPPPSHHVSYDGRLWKGWMLPASDADTWFVAGSAKYKYVLESKDSEEALNSARAVWRGLALGPDTPLDHFRREQVGGAVSGFPAPEDGRRRVPEADG